MEKGILKEAVERSLQMAALWDEVKDKLNDAGTSLSGGQQQRLAISRALVKEAPILVLDEATSALDSISEMHIKNAIATLRGEVTQIIIAHRLSTIRQMDRIIVIEKGEIIEDGTHDELAKKKNGLYKKLWDLQAGGFKNRI